MSADRDHARLVDMLVNGRYVIQSVSGISRAEFDADREKQDSVILRISIVGEAARHVSDTARLALAQLPWGKITGMRHRLVHEYNRVDYETVWRVATVYVPEMVRELESHLLSLGIDPHRLP